MMKKSIKLLLIIFAALIVLSGATYLLSPSVRFSVDWRVKNAQTWLYYALYPPEKAAFVPNTPLPAVATHTAPAATAFVADATGVVASPAAKSTAVATITATPEPLPPSVSLEGVRYEDQHGHLNYCGPANLSMALSFWKWKGNRETVGDVVKPEEKDKNVSPHEMVQFVENETDLAALVREGGSEQLLKRLLAAGYPVLIEKGVYLYEALTGRIGWMGHFNVVTGYDDAAKFFIAQDSYLENGRNHKFTYDDLMSQWRSFNNVFIVVYPKDQQDKVFAVLGDYADGKKSFKIAYQAALKDKETLEGYDKFFALFNAGSSLTGLEDYEAAIKAYDQAFIYFAAQPKEKRPWRMMWYQIGPYVAYFNSGRYEDVVKLADETLATASDPYLEETNYWRFKARYALGLEK